MILLHSLERCLPLDEVDLLRAVGLERAIVRVQVLNASYDPAGNRAHDHDAALVQRPLC
jgi:hypothetical protein